MRNLCETLSPLESVWIEEGVRGGEREGSKVELAKNKLILDQFHYSLLSLIPPQSKWTIKVLRSHN